MMYTTKKIKNYTFLFLTMGFFIFPFIARAAQADVLSLSVAPQIFELDVFPGEKISQKITIGNLSEAALPIEAKVVDFSATDDSGEMIFDESERDPSISSKQWFEIEKPNFILETKESREVFFTIDVPANAEPGGHYSAVLFEPVLPSFYFQQGLPRAIPVIGVLFLLSVKTLSLEPQTNQKIEVTEFSVPKEERNLALESFFSKTMANVAEAADITVTEKSPSKFILKVKNNDIYHAKISGGVTIYDVFGNKVKETSISQKTILPGKIRDFPVDFSPEIPDKLKWLPAAISNFLVRNFFVGKYEVRLELNAKSSFSADISQLNMPNVLTFFSLPWKFWLPVIIISGLFIFLILKYRKRINLAAFALIRNKK